MKNPNGLFKQKLINFIVKMLSFEDDIVGTIVMLAKTKYCSEWTRHWDQIYFILMFLMGRILTSYL